MHFLLLRKLTSPGDTRTSASAGYTLPHELLYSDGLLNYDFKLRLTALAETVNVNISLHLLHGGHLQYLEYFNDAVDIEVEIKALICMCRSSAHRVQSMDRLKSSCQC